MTYFHSQAQKEMEERRRKMVDAVAASHRTSLEAWLEKCSKMGLEIKDGDISRYRKRYPRASVITYETIKRRIDEERARAEQAEADRLKALEGQPLLILEDEPPYLAEEPEATVKIPPDELLSIKQRLSNFVDDDEDGT